MAYVFGFTRDVTALIYAMRDWKLEDVKRNGGTPSRLALVCFRIDNTTAEHPPEFSNRTYYISVNTRNFKHDFYIIGLSKSKFEKKYWWSWSDANRFKFNGAFQSIHGMHVYPCSQTIPQRDWPNIEYDSDMHFDENGAILMELLMRSAD